MFELSVADSLQHSNTVAAIKRYTTVNVKVTVNFCIAPRREHTSKALR